MYANDPGNKERLVITHTPHYRSVPLDMGRTFAMNRLEYLKENDRITQEEYETALPVIDSKLPE